MNQELRRKSPRRTFHGQVGVMYDGHMTISRCSQLGEGGLLVRLDESLEGTEVGDQMVVTLYLPNIGGVVAKSKCVYLTEDVKIGIQFEEIEMRFKVRIREFVSRQKSSPEI